MSVFRIKGYGGEHDETGAYIVDEMGNRACDTPGLSSFSGNSEPWLAYVRHAEFVRDALNAYAETKRLDIISTHNVISASEVTSMAKSTVPVIRVDGGTVPTTKNAAREALNTITDHVTFHETMDRGNIRVTEARDIPPGKSIAFTDGSGKYFATATRSMDGKVFIVV